MAPSNRPTLERKPRLLRGIVALVIAGAGYGCSGGESQSPGQPGATGSGGAGAAGTAGAGGESDSGGTSGGGGGEAQAGASGRAFEDIAAELRTAIAEHPTDVPFTLLLGNDDGTFFEGSKGDSTATTSYESASTSKWVSAAVILSLVERGYLTLDARPQDFITWWTADAGDPRSQVTLRQLLSFTSGMQPPPPDMDALCISVPLGSFENCVQNVYETAGASALTPGEEFIYGQNHLQVAGLMAIEARDVTGFGEIFAEFQELTGLFPSGAFDLPSASKPRLAGGMHWTGEEYMGFLHALYSGELLGSELREQMFTDHTPVPEVAITESPVERGLGLAWHYGLGNWRECPFPDWEAECEPVGRVSSPGLYGAYPFIDFGRGFYGILARQGSGGTFRDGLEVYSDLEPLILELVAAAL